MLKLLVAAIALVAVVTSFDLDTEWSVFKATYNKKYGVREEMKRKAIWADNKIYINQHNKLYNEGVFTYFLGENEYADMTHEEFVAVMNGAKMTTVPTDVHETHRAPKDLPDTVDWRTKGYVTPVKTQGNCGSCWAFSTTGAIEGQHFKATGKLVSLSESNLLDCAQPWGDAGCNGGWPYLAYEYVIANNGIDTEVSYPYQPQMERCRFNQSAVGATLSSFRNIAWGLEDLLQEKVAEVGPVSVCVDASHRSFHLYSGGVYYESACSNIKLNHAILVVGYGTDAGQKYWMVKNSWGTSWGLQGYIKMIRDYNNACGIASAASYPIV